MKNYSPMIELVSPAGGADKLAAAVNNGCDAVYLGGKSFSARSMAENFTAAGLEAAVDYAHLRGVKVYVTVNTLYTDDELNDLFKFCAGAYRAGADAFIVQDIGAALRLKDMFDIPLHASTQLTARTSADAQYLRGLGFKRLVLSRETPLEEIRKISALGIETEVFIHGALCYSHSGQCLMSSFLGGRSGNRGNCAQPCRLKYRLEREGIVADGCLLSPKDMMTLEILPEILESGVTALKIEGRMKSAEYVALVTKTYSDALAGVALGGGHINDLTQVFNRGGSFCAGYFKTHSSAEMMSTVSPKSSGVLIGEVVNYIPRMGKCVISLTGGLVGGDGIEIWTKAWPHVGTNYNSAVPAEAGDTVTVNISGDISRGDKVYKSYDKRLSERLSRLAAQTGRRQRLDAFVSAKAGQELALTLRHGDITVETKTERVETALKQPLTKERLLAQLSKTGGTAFELMFSGCDIGDNIYADIKTVNNTRRLALAEMERRIIASYKREAQDPPTLAITKPATAKPRLTVQVNDPAQARAVIRQKPYRVYLECTKENLKHLDALATEAHANCVQLFIALPACPWPDEDKLMHRLGESGIDGYLARTYAHLTLPAALALDYSFNVMNSLAIERLSALASSVCLSPELTDTGFAGAAGEVIVYGRLTLMTTNQCPVGIYDGKKSGGMYCGLRNSAEGYRLIDRKGMEFPVVRDCESCTARILSCRAIERKPGSAGYMRVVFTTEDADECVRVLRGR